MAGLLLGLVTTATVQAQTVSISNMDAGYDTTLGYTLSGSDNILINGENSWAVGFTTPSALIYFQQAELAIGHVPPPFGGANILDIALASDDGGRPGALLETFHLVDAMEDSIDTFAPVTVNSTLFTALNPDTQYWLTVVSGNDTWAVWASGSADLYNTSTRNDGVNWSTAVAGTPFAPAFRVTGTTTLPTTSAPEPSSLALIFPGLVAIGFTLRKKRV